MDGDGGLVDVTQYSFIHDNGHGHCKVIKVKVKIFLPQLLSQSSVSVIVRMRGAIEAALY